ncbi:MAG: GNAT family N-acetyltransferase [Rhodothermales bacterium]|nr:GNAT family N-acetyltransferase [Rhodothermales bacterium]
MAPDLRVRPVRTGPDWAAARALRQRVFVEEQACPPEEEWDAHDLPEARGRTCHHLLGFVGDEAVAVARWRPVKHAGRSAAKLERFAVRASWRGHGLGRAMVAATLEAARAAGHRRFVLHAQAHLQRLYEAFGFRPVGDVFEEAGIPHVTMVKDEGPGPEG